MVELLAPDRRDDAAEHWHALARLAPPAQLPASWAWIDAWLRHYGRVVDHRFALARDAHGPFGAALVTRDVISAGPLRIRRLHLGTAGEPPGSSVWVERNGLAAVPGREAEFSAGLTTAIHELDGWDALCLPGFVPTVAEHLLTAPLRWEVERLPCWVADLTAGSGGAIELLGPATRRNVRRGINKLGLPEVTWARDVPSGLAMLAELAQLSARRRPRSPFLDARFRAFHRRLVTTLLHDGTVWLARITTERHLLAVAYGFREGRRLIGYQTERGPDLDVPVSVGTLADVALMDAARDAGFEIYDPLAGDSGGHKRRLATHRHDLVWARGRRGRAIWHAHDAGRALRRYVRPRATTA